MVRIPLRYFQALWSSILKMVWAAFLILCPQFHLSWTGRSGSLWTTPWAPMWPCCVRPQGSLCRASPGSRMELLSVRRRQWWGNFMNLSHVSAGASKCVCCPESSLQWQWSIRGNRLELGPLTLSHAGTYTCVAKNSEGQTQKDYTLTVQGKEKLTLQYHI